MKKLMSLAVALLMLFSFSSKAFAEENTTTLTPEQQAARERFKSAYMDKMTVLVDLRVQTRAAVAENNTLTAQIKEKLKITNKEDVQAKIAKIKEISEKNKALVAQAKALHVQRTELTKKFQEAIKNRDTAAMATLKDQINALNVQIETIRQQIIANKETMKPLVEELKAIKAARKDTNVKVKALFEQAKALHKKIVAEEEAKAKLWETYKANISAKNYDAALATLDSIIEAKRQILTDIKAKTEILKNILALLV